ncbi:haloalkane dehalogenase [Mycobacterium sp. 1165196.3]|uniref:haloalkane dehalogenase n=1 Tax=Mycobacterium sp. 1165196.3 TaxID=1834071 RepID=UPI0007FE337C|nr:haloalkane dehalogenase [Mycobacterium sp. 1165196.3]OBK39365.1 haloalkane dehalogenase [Mycobacterium sp. 1165196.3]
MPHTTVVESTVFHLETGCGQPIVFLHGNPTSSFIWRAILPDVGRVGRCLAPDLIGMGASGKPEIGYSFADHADYLDAWINALDLPPLVFVGYDWGAALAFDWAAHHPDRVRAVAFTEPIVRPLATAEFPEAARAMFAALRTPEVGERMVLQENVFIEQALTSTVLRGLRPDELQAYREPYPTPESRRPMLAWPRMMPLDGQPAEVVARIEAYDRWLATSDDVPKLLMTCPPGPGLMMTPELIDWCRNHIAALELAELGPAGHHVPEDQSPAIADELVQWLLRHGLCEAPMAPRSESVTEDA